MVNLLLTFTSLGDATVSSFMETVLDDATASAARDTLGLGNYVDILNNLGATVDPTVNNDSAEGYTVGSRWINVTGGTTFICTDDTVGAAVWTSGSIVGVFTAIASQVEAETGTDNTKGMTPLRTFQAIDARVKYTGGNRLALHENLYVTTDAVNPDEQVDVTADAVLLTDGAGNYHRVTSVNETADNTASGEGGINTGSVAADTWYYIYLISDGGSNVGLTLSTSIGDPAVSGRDYYGLVGAVKTDASSDFVAFHQYGAEAFLDVMPSDGTIWNTSAQLITTQAPPNTWARLWTYFSAASIMYGLVTAPEQTDVAAGPSNFDILASASVAAQSKEVVRRVNSSSQVRVRSSATASSSFIGTQGWRFE